MVTASTQTDKQPQSRSIELRKWSKRPSWRPISGATKSVPKLALWLWRTSRQRLLPVRRRLTSLMSGTSSSEVADCQPLGPFQSHQLYVKSCSDFCLNIYLFNTHLHVAVKIWRLQDINLELSVHSSYLSKSYLSYILSTYFQLLNTRDFLSRIKWWIIWSYLP